MKLHLSLKLVLLGLGFTLAALVLMLHFFFNPAETKAKETIAVATELLERHSISSSSVNWKIESESALKLLGANPRRRDVEKALQHLILATGQAHTFYLDARTYSKLISNESQSDSAIGSIELLDQEIPLIKLSGYTLMNAEASSRDAAAFRTKLISSAKDSKCGIILDLSRNTGGNLYAMLQAIAPLLPARALGYHVDKSGNRTAILKPENIETSDLGYISVAVMTSSSTGSSGEYLLTAIRAATRVRTFGQPTFGFTTGNVPFELPNGGAIAITTSRLLDSRGKEVAGAIDPDQFERDYGTARYAAAAWLRSQCSGGPQSS